MGTTLAHNAHRQPQIIERPHPAQQPIFVARSKEWCIGACALAHHVGRRCVFGYDERAAREQRDARAVRAQLCLQRVPVVAPVERATRREAVVMVKRARARLRERRARRAATDHLVGAREVRDAWHVVGPRRAPDGCTRSGRRW